MSEQLVLFNSSQNGVITVTLNRPAKRNALNCELLEALEEKLDRIAMDESARVMILRGAGPVFCAGLDLAEARDLSKASRSRELIERTLTKLYQLPLVTIAAVQGVCAAGGAGYMTACDLVVAASDAVIGYPEVRRGLVAALVMTLLRRQIGERAIRELLLTGSMISADRAFQIGLVNRVVATGELDPTIDELTNAVLSGAPGACRLSKVLLRDLWPETFADSLAKAHDIHLKARESNEAQEGFSAFLEKREPFWTHKPR